MRHPHHVIVLIAAAGLGCVTVNMTLLPAAHRWSPVPARDLDVFFADDSPPPLERVAIRFAKGPEDWTDESEMLDKLRKEAGKLSANAMVLNRMKDPSLGERVLGTVGRRRGQPQG